VREVTPGQHSWSTSIFESHYNIACVLRALALIQKRWPDALLTVAGDGPQREQLRQLARDLSLRNVRFVGRVPPEHMPALYDEHDVWLNGSDVDNMPTSILEAYACGLAVAGTNPGGIPYIVEDGPGDWSNVEMPKPWPRPHWRSLEACRPLGT